MTIAHIVLLKTPYIYIYIYIYLFIYLAVSILVSALPFDPPLLEYSSTGPGRMEILGLSGPSGWPPLQAERLPKKCGRPRELPGLLLPEPLT